MEIIMDDQKTEPGFIESESCLKYPQRFCCQDSNSDSDSDFDPETQHNYIDIRALIRSVQRAKGHQECFRNGHSKCDQTVCTWRHLCLD